MAFGKSSAYDSGMRGQEKPTLEPSDADRESMRAARGQVESTEDGDFDINDHVSKDEDGHHQLNLTTLAEAIHKKGGIHGE